MLNNNPFHAQLLKLAGDQAAVVDEPMNPDPTAVISPEEVDAAKAQSIAEQEGAQAQAEAEAAQVGAQAMPGEEEVAQANAQAQAEAEAAQAAQAQAEQVEAQVALEQQQQAEIMAAAENIVAQESTPAVPGEVPPVPVLEQFEPTPIVADPIAPEQLSPEIAAQLPEYGAIAKLAELATSGFYPEYIQKEASDRLTTAMTDFDSYVAVIEKSASELFGTDEQLSELHSPDGISFVLTKLSEFIDANPIEKTADEGESFSGKVIKSVSNFVDSVANMKGIGEEIEKAQAAYDVAKNEANNAVMSNFVPGGYEGKVAEQSAAMDTLTALERKQQKGRAGVIAGVGLAGAGAYAGGKALYNAYKNKEELNEENANDTLESGNQKQIIGGSEKMANTKQLVKDFLKTAGAAGLVAIANDENAGIEMQKEASDRFDSIASMGRTDMLNAFEKVATEIYSEDQLKEIVAGQHTEMILNKLAGIMSYNEMSTAEVLEKVADAGGVAAKGVAGALTDAHANVEATIKKDKEETEGAGREYVGDTDGPGKVGGGLVGETGGYNVVNNPAKYNVDKTASEIVEEAVMVKQAAEKSWNEAVAVIAQYTK
jgi:hypothetical protein